MTIVTCQKCGAKNRVDERRQNLQPVCGKCGAKLQLAAQASGTPRVVTDASFATDVLGVRGKPVLVDCWAQWCGPCRMIGPIIDELASESAGRWVIAKLNVDENPGISGQFHIDSIPALLIFRDGKLVDRIVGLQSKSVIAGRLQALAGASV